MYKFGRPLDEHFEIVQEKEDCDAEEIAFYVNIFGRRSTGSTIGSNIQKGWLHLLFFEISMYLCDCSVEGNFVA